MSSETGHEHGSTKTYIAVWVSLVALSGLEVLLAYQSLTVIVMLFLLLSLSIFKAGLIISYFMHLLQERLSLKLSLIPALVFVIALLFFFFPDAVRVNELKP